MKSWIAKSSTHVFSVPFRRSVNKVFSCVISGAWSPRSTTSESSRQTSASKWWARQVGTKSSSGPTRPSPLSRSTGGFNRIDTLSNMFPNMLESFKKIKLFKKGSIKRGCFLVICDLCVCQFMWTNQCMTAFSVHRDYGADAGGAHLLARGHELPVRNVQVPERHPEGLPTHLQLRRVQRWNRHYNYRRDGCLNGSGVGT